MPLKYHLIKRAIPNNSKSSGHYYASVKATRVVNTRELCDILSDNTSLNSAVVIAVIEAFIQFIPELLKKGYVVKLDEFGSFSPTLSSEGVESPEQFKTSMIKKVIARFRPGKEFKKNLSDVELKKVND